MTERWAVLRVAPGPLTGLGGQLLLLAALAQTIGLGHAGWTIGAASAVVLDTALARALWRNAAARLGPAGWVTLTRASLAVGVAALTAASFARDVPTAPFVVLACAALALDFVDGRVARRTGTVSALGAWLDGEVDAFLILALSVKAAPAAGAWVLAIGALRYAFLAAGWPLPWMRAPLPRRDWRKVAAAAQGIALTLAVTSLVPVPAMRVVLAAALALLVESFGRDVWWLWRHRRSAGAERAGAARRPVTVALTTAAFAIVWVALAAPTRPALLTPAAFVRVPLEGVALVLLAALLPRPARRVLTLVVGPLLGVLAVVKLLDIGFFIAFDRPFNPVDDWSYASIAVETLRDTFDSTVADLVAAGAALVAVAALGLPALAVRRVTRTAAGHQRIAVRAVVGLAVVGTAAWALGVASLSAVDAKLAVQEVRAVRVDLRDRARFRVQLATDRYRTGSAANLLTGLRGKDVLLVFVESYGRLAVEGSSFSPAIDRLLANGTKGLAAAGFSARSGWLTSSTFGGGSWLAHATLQSGTWVDSEGRYEDLISSNRLTLTTAFGKAGWRTVADVPSDTRDWPEGKTFYRYDKIYDRRNLGYRGPKYAFAAMPDQYVLLALQRFELAKRTRLPIFSEIDLVSSHTPWTRIPPLIGWNRVGDGSIFKRLPIDGSGIGDPAQGYSKSIEYTLSTLFSFVEHYGDKNLVLVVLGDHQPSRVVSGSPGHDVPISIIAHDPAVLSRVDSWGWADGMQPSATGPDWPMSAFRDRFLSAFGS